ncbi:CsbD family protein [Corynebacterium cystitidis]|uniref:CsbD-like n=1 Tax=Corynebacterium cystitidis DSM 20524 TaxID=1121357 RepID=A0A1H9U7P4_9CORY|nr:CsbD family protein [Corynebacterium cystitidis]WJY81213.1 CsbD-like protein [Corynebacterium cystitidis DSM 20524]SES05281.1 CsbD-like [Corynebacterium cystitidis DSM 20524]SNV89375.1 CsbD family protein probably involved in stress response [Corynebacterium cystitidis]
MADVDNQFEKAGGKIKEGVGEVTDNDSMKDEGKADQTKADLKDKISEAGDKVKDAANKVIGSFQNDDKDNK